MCKNHRIINALLFFVAVWVITARPAHAYIDPGTGSYILQIVLAFILGALFAVKMFWKNVKSFIVNLFTRGNKKGSDKR